MENIFLTSLTTPEVAQIFRKELENYFSTYQPKRDEQKTEIEAPINAKELTIFLGVTGPTLIRWRKKGKIPFMRLGGRILYQKSAVLAALENKKGASKQ